MLLLFPDPFWLSPGDRTCPEEPVDRRSFRRNQNKKIKAKKKKEFYFKNRSVGCCFFFFLFAFSTLSFRHHNTIYRYTIFLKKPISDDFQKNTDL